jgi:hypothetical protein
MQLKFHYKYFLAIYRHIRCTIEEKQQIKAIITGFIFRDEDKMKEFKIIGIIALSVILISSMPNNKEVVYYNSLKQLKSAGPPEKIKLINTDNIATGKSMLAEGLLFTYKDRKAGKVLISGNFSSWKTRNMVRGKDGVWFYFLSGSDFAGKVEYKFNVDGLWTEDPLNFFRQDDKMGSYFSVAENDPPSDGRLVSYKFTSRNRVLFRTYRPEARIISLVGDFNAWNPENDLMKRGNNGIWSLEKRLPAGVYRYKFIIDGRWVPDTFNPDSASDNAGDLCSIIRVK